MSNDEVKILFLEHDLNDVELVQRQLRQEKLNFELKVAKNCEEFKKSLVEYQPDLVLADYRMPNFSGLDALACCKEHDDNLPFIFVTGSISEEVAVESIKAGAWDYVLKDNLLRLESAIGYALKLKEERKQREEAQRRLIASEELHRQIFETAADIICIVDENGIIKECNRQIQVVFDYTPEEVVGKAVYNFIDQNNYPKVELLLRECLETGKFYNKEFRLLNKHGKEVHLAVSGAGLDYHDGKYHLIVAIARDITSRVFLEMQVQKAEKQESLTMLARGLTHDFNNILTVIMGNASLLQMFAGHDPKLSHYLENILNAGQRAKEITDQMMRYAKGVSLNIKSGSIASLLKESVRIVLAGSNIKPVLEIPDDLWKAEMDEGQISQVINNLVINALQAMPQGGQIILSVKNVVVKPEDPLFLKPGEYVCIAVKDAGCGISPENMTKLFTPYFTTKEKGNGLGLANAYTIVKNHNGLITAESQVGVGSTFYVYLPASKIK